MEPETLFVKCYGLKMRSRSLKSQVYGCERGKGSLFLFLSSTEIIYYCW